MIGKVYYWIRLAATPSSMAVLFVALLLNNWFNADSYTREPAITGDAISYYAYLPAYFVYGDLSLSFMDTQRNVNYGDKFWPVDGPNNSKVIKTTCGMSLAYLPFFLWAHIQTVNGPHPEEATGFSTSYHKAIYAFGLVAGILGAVYLRLLLLLHFREWPTAITILAICLGTNYFVYSTVDAKMPHVMGFMLCAASLYHYFRWISKPKWYHALAFSIALGWATLIRPVNGMFLLVPLLHFVVAPGLRSRIAIVVNAVPQIPLFIIGPLILFGLQLIYWKYVTGSWLFFSYTDERFWWQYPHVLDGLFSYRKGLFLYAPVLILGFVGIGVMFRSRKPLASSLTLFLMIYMYVIFSWWAWWYGGSFGMRAMIDVFPILGLGMAGLLQSVFDIQTLRTKRLAVGITLFAIFVLGAFGWFKVWQQKHWLVHYDGNTKASYWRAFLATEGIPGLDTLFVSPDYDGRLRTGIEHGTGY